MSDFPDWWPWPLRLTDHLLLRMRQRNFNATDLRMMLEDTFNLVPAEDPGRWIANTKLHGHPWKIVLEPDPSDHTITVITAFQVE